LSELYYSAALTSYKGARQRKAKHTSAIRATQFDGGWQRVDLARTACILALYCRVCRLFRVINAHKKERSNNLRTGNLFAPPSVASTLLGRKECLLNKEGQPMKADSQLQHDVLEELEWRPSIDASRIGVAAANGVVTLTGSVPQYADKMEAERIAKSVAGVKAVADDIDVRLAGTINDTAIATAALSALKWHIWIPNEKIKVTVRDGWITLEGTVDWQYQREAASEAVCHLQGVKGVTNEIAITVKPQPNDIRERIEAAFKRSAEVDARHVQVEARDNRVVLIGNVSNSAEREEAERVAWAAPGVTAVENRLTVGG
jgi:osmotically-inducible protein OsmY